MRFEREDLGMSHWALATGWSELPQIERRGPWVKMGTVGWRGWELRYPALDTESLK